MKRGWYGSKTVGLKNNQTINVILQLCSYVIQNCSYVAFVKLFRP